MMDGFLKFTTKQAALDAFTAVGVTLQDGELPAFAHVGVDTLAIDVLFGNGVIWRSTGVTLTDGEGNPYQEMEPVTGYHVNVRWSGDTLPADLAPFDAAPATPKCVFAGATVATGGEAVPFPVEVGE